jgi:hypothetical protein
MGEPLQQHLSLQPQEVVWQDVRFNTAYKARVEISNNVDAPVELQIRAGSSDRYTITPQQLTLQPRSSAQVSVQLKVLRFANKAKAIEQGQRDIFYIKVGGWACRRAAAAPLDRPR